MEAFPAREDDQILMVVLLDYVACVEGVELRLFAARCFPTRLESKVRGSNLTEATSWCQYQT